MKHLEVLVVTKKTTSVRILNWKVSTVTDAETAIETLQHHPFQVVAISHSISELDRNKLIQLAPVLFSSAILMEFKDENNLSEQVKTAYWSKRRPDSKRNYLDNSFEITLAHSINN